jgi:hypothetical protein
MIIRGLGYAIWGYGELLCGFVGRDKREIRD